MWGVCFSPWMDGQDPTRGDRISAEALWARLGLVAADASAFRTYGVGSGLENAAWMFKVLGKESWIGAWLGPDPVANEAQIRELAQVAQAGHVDVAVIGSEVLLRGDLTVEQLRSCLALARELLPESVPVTTAEVYHVLLANPEVAQDCDMLFVNYYPFWEGESVDAAVTKLAEWHTEVLAFADGKSVVISETGWPSAGDPHEEAEPSPVNAARFFDEFTRWAAATDVRYFYFSCFDESWKSGHEGNVGSHWGYRDAHGAPKQWMAQHLADRAAAETPMGTGAPGAARNAGFSNADSQKP